MPKTILSNSIGIKISFNENDNDKYLIDFISDDVSSYFPKKTNIDEIIIIDNPLERLDSQSDKIID